MECLCSLVIIKDENVFGYPRIRRHIWVFSKCFDKLLSFFKKKPKNFCFYRTLNVNGTNEMRIGDDSDAIFTGPVTDSGIL